MYEFDADTRLDRQADGAFSGTLSPRWNVGAVPNGGYVLAVAVSALGAELEGLDPLSVTAHYLRPCVPGPVSVRVETVKRGRSYSTAMARVVQNDRETARVLGTYGVLGRGGQRHVEAVPPELPARDAPAPVALHGQFAPEIHQRFDVRPRGETLGFFAGQPLDHCEIAAWIRFADGRLPDLRSLALFADALPPPSLHVLPLGWVPTLELTVHFRARPVSEWLRVVFRTRFLFDGFLEEDGELWDESGQLVALSRQLAAVRAG